MIWGKTTDERDKKTRNEYEWHAKFIWLWPVKLQNGRWVWLETVIQKRASSDYWVRKTEAQYVKDRMMFREAAGEQGQKYPPIPQSPPFAPQPIVHPNLQEIAK